MLLLSKLQNDFEVVVGYQEGLWPERGNEEIGNRSEENEIYLQNKNKQLITTCEQLNNKVMMIQLVMYNKGRKPVEYSNNFLELKKLTLNKIYN